MCYELHNVHMWEPATKRHYQLGLLIRAATFHPILAEKNPTRGGFFPEGSRDFGLFDQLRWPLKKGSQLPAPAESPHRL